jgi:hypothetical protein
MEKESHRTSEQAGPGRTLLNDDDLESIDGDSVPALSTGQSSSSTRFAAEQEQSEEESDGLGDLVSSSDEEEEEGVEVKSEPGPSNAQQTRIRARRAGRDERPIAGLEEVGTTRRKKRKTQRGTAEDAEADTRTRTKKSKKPRAYAGPEVYEHLRPLPDLLVPDLDGESAALLQGR